jgi:hypothetical protein
MVRLPDDAMPPPGQPGSPGKDPSGARPPETVTSLRVKSPNEPTYIIRNLAADGSRLMVAPWPLIVIAVSIT